MNMIGTNNLKKYFSLIVVLFPILNIYASPIPKVTLSEFLLFLFFVVAICIYNTRLKVTMVFLLFCVYIFIDTFIVLTIVPDSLIGDSVGTLARLLFLYAMLFLFSKQFFDFGFGVKALHIVSSIISIYALIQTFFALFDIYLINYIPFLPDMGEGAGNTYAEILAKAAYGLQFRPCSILREPSAVGCYLSLSLSILLFTNKKPRIFLFLSLLYSLVMFITMSSTAIIMLCILWVCYFWKYSIKNRKSIQKIIPFVFAIFLVLIIAGATGIIEYFMERTFGGDFSISGLMQSTRFKAISSMFDSSDTWHGVLFGAGLQDRKEYLPGFARVYYGMGLIGFFLVIIQLYQMYKTSKGEQKMVAISYIILNIGTEILLGCMGFMFLPFIVSEFNLFDDEKN